MDLNPFFNQFSVIWMSLLAVAFVVVLLRWRRIPWPVIGLALVGILLVGGGIYLSIRPGTSDTNTVDESISLINNGRPTFLEFFSNYCVGCLAVKPAVDALASEINDEYDVIRVDIHTALGRELRERFGFSYTPEFILFDVAGEIIWRGNSLPSDEQLSLAKTLRDEAIEDS